MEYTPGPIVVDPLPLPPRILEPRAFERLAAELGAFVTAGDGVLASHVATLAPDTTGPIGAAFEGDVVPAIGALGSLDLASDAADLSGVVRAIDSAVGDLELVAADLPSPDDDADPPPFDPGGPPPDGGKD